MKLIGFSGQHRVVGVRFKRGLVSGEGKNEAFQNQTAFMSIGGYVVKSRAEQEAKLLSASPEEVQPSQKRYRWVMLVLVWLLYAVFGIVNRSIAPLVTPILKDLNISYSQMGVILGAWPLTYIGVAAVGGAIMDKWGIRKSLVAGIIIIGLSAVLRYFANSFATMFLCVALFGVGGPMLSIGCPKTIAMWFNEKDRGTAVGIYMTGVGIGGLLALSLTNSVVMPLTGDSWRLTFVVYGLLAFVGTVLWWFVARDVKSTEPTESASITKVFADLIRIRNVQLVLIMGFLSFSISHGFTNWLPSILETGGLSPAVAGFAASIPTLVGIPSLLIIPSVVPPHLRGRTIASGYLMLAIILWVVMTTKGVSLITGLVLFGVTSSFGMPLLILVLMDIPKIGSRYMGSAAGMFFCVAEIGGFAGPFMVGAIKDLTGSFLMGAILLSGLSAIVFLTALLLETKPASEIKA
jgi:cyanate permease